MPSLLLAGIAFTLFMLATTGRIRLRPEDAPTFEMSADGRTLLEPPEPPSPYSPRDNAVRVLGAALGVAVWIAIPFEPFYGGDPLSGAGYKLIQMTGLAAAALGAGFLVAGILSNLSAPGMNLGVERVFLQGGVYALVRYPVYLGAILLYMGLAMLSRALIPILIAPLFPLSLLRHLVAEDESNHAMFGPAYAEYRARTPALFPFPVNLVALALYLVGLFLALRDRGPGSMIWW